MLSTRTGGFGEPVLHCAQMTSLLVEGLTSLLCHHSFHFSVRRPKITFPLHFTCSSYSLLHHFTSPVPELWVLRIYQSRALKAWCFKALPSRCQCLFIGTSCFCDSNWIFLSEVIHLIWEHISGTSSLAVLSFLFGFINLFETLS